MRKVKKTDSKTAVLGFEELANSQLGMSFAKVMENTCVLHCAQGYLRLCQNLSEASYHRARKAPISFLPSDLAAVEKGVGVLCAAYTHAQRYNNTDVCRDVEKQLSLLSSFYQKKIASAYFSACNVLFDSDDVADKPEVLKQLQVSRDELQQVHFDWPISTEDENLTTFFEKVEMYGRQLGIEGKIQPEKKAERTVFFSHISPIISVNSREM